VIRSLAFMLQPTSLDNEEGKFEHLISLLEMQGDAKCILYLVTISFEKGACVHFFISHLEKSFIIYSKNILNNRYINT